MLQMVMRTVVARETKAQYSARRLEITTTL